MRQYLINGNILLMNSNAFTLIELLVVVASGSSKKQIALWIKTHVGSDYKPVLIKKDGWCN